ncbi:MAG: hypothetical protein INR72_13885 [Williamsia herbipolensis]|nr:hypothetical protein [Williamsia herbipolensis]
MRRWSPRQLVTRLAWLRQLVDEREFLRQQVLFAIADDTGARSHRP